MQYDYCLQVVGNPGSTGIANIATSQFDKGIAWPLGAAIGVVMTVAILAVLALLPLLLGVYRRLADSSRTAKRDDPTHLEVGSSETVLAP